MEKKRGNPNWVKGGKSPNPGGRRDDTRELAALARGYTLECVQTVYGIMVNKKAMHSDRLRAAQILLERGHGKPVQEINATVDVAEASFEDVSTRVAAILASAAVEPDPEPVGETN